jgi:protein-tyrosine phosphatase
MSARYRILMVCTGNICRSPTAEAVLRKRLADSGLHRGVEVDSAGTVDYHVGSPPDHRAQAHAARRGYDLSRLRARHLRPADFEQFDLLLAMDADHLNHMLERCPQPYRESPTLTTARQRVSSGCSTWWRRHVSGWSTICDAVRPSGRSSISTKTVGLSYT